MLPRKKKKRFCRPPRHTYLNLTFNLSASPFAPSRLNVVFQWGFLFHSPSDNLRVCGVWVNECCVPTYGENILFFFASARACQDPSALEGS